MRKNQYRSSKKRFEIGSKHIISITFFFIKVDRLEDELVEEQEKYKAITEELEATFAETSGY